MKKNLFISLLVSAATYPLIYRIDYVHDFGFVVDTCWRVAHGQMPYWDWSCPRTPLFFLINGLIMKIGGLMGLKIWLCVEQGLIVFLILELVDSYSVLQKFLPCFLSIAWSPILIQGFNWPDIDAMIYVLIGLILMLGDRGILAMIPLTLCVFTNQKIGMGMCAGMAGFDIIRNRHWRTWFKWQFWGMGMFIFFAWSDMLRVNGDPLGYWIVARAARRVHTGIVQDLYHTFWRPDNNFLKAIVVLHLALFWQNRRSRWGCAVLAYSLAVLVASCLGKCGNGFQLYLLLIPVLFLISRGFWMYVLFVAIGIYPILTYWNLPRRWIEVCKPVNCFYLTEGDSAITKGLIDWQRHIPGPGMMVKKDGSDKWEPYEKTIFVYKTPLFFYYLSGRVNPMYQEVFLDGFEYLDRDAARVKEDLKKCNYVLVGKYKLDQEQENCISVDDKLPLQFESKFEYLRGELKGFKKIQSPYGYTGLKRI